MRFLLDTHVLLWWAHEPEKLSRDALAAIGAGGEILASAVSAFEIATKHRQGKLEYDTPLSDRFSWSIAELGFKPLSVDCSHAERAGALAGSHKDPWDRLLTAQAQLEEVPLVTADRRIAAWDVHIIW